MLARAIERHLTDDPQSELLFEPDDDRMFIELAGSYFALLLSHELPKAQHAQLGGRHGLYLAKRDFYDPFEALERVLAGDDVCATPGARGRAGRGAARDRLSARYATESRPTRIGSCFARGSCRG